ncbi:MAG: phosphatidylglycerol lysyltransferase [Treponema sp.]|jgi:phosphoglucomutase|nr:phosphatidylglycerol lysyltransferase [Treponema sp.]
MVLHDEAITALTETLSGMILSHSGWRGVFAAEGEEGRGSEISAAHRIIAAGAALVFADYLHGLGEKPLVLVGSDTRPTGKAITEAVISVLPACGCRVRRAGVAAAPEIMAWARSFNTENCGFIYISASHNPIGYNGLKFGLADGGVLSAEEAGKLTARFRAFISDPENIARLEELLNGADFPALSETAAGTAKQEAWDAYFNFTNEAAWGGNTSDIIEAFKRGIGRRPLGVCCDFNGSARCVSIDQKFFESLGMQFAAINGRPGEIAHRIVPEGESLEPCRAFLEEQRRLNPAFVLGYVPDCDGDRGNLVIWDETLGRARALDAQEVFALACAAELAQLAWGGGLGGGKTAVVVNDPTSLRVDRIAGAFGARVFRAEVGEANVVGLARKLREEGYTVRILGEGSNGGNIIHPSAVRDPLHTVLAIAKFLSLRSSAGKPGLFELWCSASGQAGRCRADFSLNDIIASLPPFATTGAYSAEAALNVSDADHGALKGRYQKIFLREWEERKEELKNRYGIYSWQASAYNGVTERGGIIGFGEAGKGGLKICFHNADGAAIASIWMRGSATEPVFRVIADAEGTDRRFERELIEWQRRMAMEADKGE